jgi:hypothetical protein
MQPIDFAAFAADCVIAGRVTMFGDRLTDFLNGQERFHLHHVELESLDDGRLVRTDSVSVPRADLLAVVATGPRGSAKRRVPLRRSRLQVCIGPYLILGYLHSKPGSDVMTSVIKREPMIPLTEATIAYSVAGRIVARDVATVIVNRLQVDWITPTTEAATIFPDVPIRAAPTSMLAKDFTGTTAL